MAEKGVSVLERRRIEAEIIKPVHRILARELGREAADRIIGEAVAETAEAAGREAAARLGQGDLLAFASILPEWSRDDALEMEIIESTGEKLYYDVTRCRYAEMYQRMGLSELGLILSCERDGAFMRGFAPKVGLRRGSVIMGGAARCDFRYEAAQDPEEGGGS
jgi:hypothetical protein